MKILGLDVGIASLGWAFIDMDDETAQAGKIIGCGSWTFNSPEEKTQSGAKLKSADRQAFRGQRRVIRRRAQRMSEIRTLFYRENLIPSSAKDALKYPGLDPWALRVEALQRPLKPEELAVALGNIAKHRGFKSNAKTDSKKNDPEGGKIKTAIEETKGRLALYPTAATMLYQDDTLVLRETKRNDGGLDKVRRFRNRDGDYSRSLLRDDLFSEVRKIFQAQRRFQQTFASTALEEDFIAIASFQRPLQDSEKLLGSCPFEPDQKRSAKRAYSFEIFRYLSKLNTLTLKCGREERRLSTDELTLALRDFGSTAKMSFSSLRKKITLPSEWTFVGINNKEESKLDVTSRTGETAAGTARLRKVIVEALGEVAWGNLTNNPEKLDAIAHMLSFREAEERIREGLHSIGLDDGLIITLLDALKEGKLNTFAGAAHISSAAARNIIPYLREGKVYSAACEEAGYTHTDSREQAAFDVGCHGPQALKKILSEQRISPDLVGSPTTRKALIEATKQVKAVIDRYGMPDRIHVELARDVGKSIEERSEITSAIEKRNKQKDKLKDLFAEETGQPISQGGRGAEELLRFQLWQEQNGRCLYCDEVISPPQLVSGDNAVQVDHILPWSRFHDDSYLNKTLCCSNCNQKKSNQTPYEWLSRTKTEEDWETYCARINELTYLKGLKKRNYKLKNTEEALKGFANRNLNDTRWTSRLLTLILQQLYPKDGTRYVFSRPGPLTDLFRHAWGVHYLKKGPDNQRLTDDRHHALDAMIVAAITESQLNRVTREVQQNRENSRKPFKNLHALPWPSFREDVEQAYDTIFVARAERRRARGQAHQATLRQVRERDGEAIIYEKKRVEDLKLSDLELLKDRERNNRLEENLRHWIEAGKPADAPPLSPKGDIISKVRLICRSKVNVPINTGNPQQPATADRGEMARVDVFRKANKKGIYQYFLVPVYPHEIATLASPPDRAVTAYKSEAEWPIMDKSYEFLWSVFSFSFLSIVTSKGEIIEGYFRGLNRSVGSIALSQVNDSSALVQGIGARTLTQFKKFSISRLGERFEIEKETRTWHGAGCI